jgi:hypothetical protein
MKTAHLASTLLIVVLLTSCSGGSTSPTPTPVDVNALQTAAVQTVVADITQTAAAVVQPTEIVPPTETPVPAPTETPTLTVTPTLSACDNSAFINDASVPDGTIMAAGQEFIKTWKVKNTGTCSWTTGYRIVFGYSNPPNEKMGGLPINLTAEVAPNADTEISVKLKAPLKSGTYSGYWKLANNNGYAFGEYFTVVIIVP